MEIISSRGINKRNQHYKPRRMTFSLNIVASDGAAPIAAAFEPRTLNRRLSRLHAAAYFILLRYSRATSCKAKHRCCDSSSTSHLNQSCTAKGFDKLSIVDNRKFHEIGAKTTILENTPCLTGDCYMHGGRRVGHTPLRR